MLSLLNTIVISAAVCTSGLMKVPWDIVGHRKLPKAFSAMCQGPVQGTEGYTKEAEEALKRKRSAGTEKNGQKHVQKERRRRQKVSELLSELKAMVATVRSDNGEDEGNNTTTVEVLTSTRDVLHQLMARLGYLESASASGSGALPLLPDSAVNVKAVKADADTPASADGAKTLDLHSTVQLDKHANPQSVEQYPSSAGAPSAWHTNSPHAVHLPSSGSKPSTTSTAPIPAAGLSTNGQVPPSLSAKPAYLHAAYGDTSLNLNGASSLQSSVPAEAGDQNSSGNDELPFVQDASCAAFMSADPPDTSLCVPPYGPAPSV